MKTEAISKILLNLCPRFFVALPLIGITFNLPHAVADCVTPPAGMVGWWPGNGNANDIVSGNNGTLQNGVTFAPGEVCQAFGFGDMDQGVSIPASSSLDIGAGPSFTVECWINPSDTTTQLPLVEWNDGGVIGPHLWINVLNSGQGGPGAVYVNWDEGQLFFASSPGLVIIGVWQHVAWTYDKASGMARLYLNGVEVASRNVGNFTPATSYPLYLGRRPAGGGVGSYNGLLDEVSLYNRALTVAEIQAIYNAGTQGKCGVGCGVGACTAQVQPPINADGSSVWTVRRGVVPVKFTLTCDGSPTCDLSPATIAVTRTAGGTQGVINESVYSMAADTGSNFRIDGCQYIYNLQSSTLGAGTYRVDILINNLVVGSATFQLK